MKYLPITCNYCHNSFESVRTADKDIMLLFPEQFKTERDAQIYLKLKYGWGVENLWRFITGCTPIVKDDRIVAVECINCNMISQLH